MNGAELQRLAAVETEVSNMRGEISLMHEKLDELRLSFAKRGGVFSAMLFSLTIGLGAVGGYISSLLNSGTGHAP